MPRGFSTKREREYKEIERKLEKAHRYPGREEEVAARIVNKQRAKAGETKSSKRRKSGGRRKSSSKSRSSSRKSSSKSVSKKSSRSKSRSRSSSHPRAKSTGRKKSSSRSRRSSSTARSGKSSSHRARSAKSRSSSRRSSKSSSHGGKVTTDHDFIRRWAEQRGGKPSAVKSTERGDDPGIIRIDFPGYSGKGSLEEISWDEWFEKFDQAKLAFLYQEETAGGEKSNFNKLISR